MVFINILATIWHAEYLTYPLSSYGFLLFCYLIFALYFQRKRDYGFIPPRKTTKVLEMRSVKVNTTNTSQVTNFTMQPQTAKRVAMSPMQ